MRKTLSLSVACLVLIVVGVFLSGEFNRQRALAAQVAYLKEQVAYLMSDRSAKEGGAQHFGGRTQGRARLA